MSNPTRREASGGSRVLSVDPRIRRIGFGCFADGSLLEWGLQIIKPELTRTQAKQTAVMRVVRMLDEYSPSVLIVPRIGPDGIRRSQNASEIIRAISKEAVRRGITVQMLTTKEVKGRLAAKFGVVPTNKVAIRRILVEQYPALEARGLRARRRWDTEQYNTPLFDAVAMYCAWYSPASP